MLFDLRRRNPDPAQKVGSSSKSTSGFTATPRAMQRQCRSFRPPLRDSLATIHLVRFQKDQLWIRRLPRYRRHRIDHRTTAGWTTREGAKPRIGTREQLGRWRSSKPRNSPTKRWKSVLKSWPISTGAWTHLLRVMIEEKQDKLTQMGKEVFWRVPHNYEMVIEAIEYMYHSNWSINKIKWLWNRW